MYEVTLSTEDVSVILSVCKNSFSNVTHCKVIRVKREKRNEICEENMEDKALLK